MQALPEIDFIVCFSPLPLKFHWFKWKIAEEKLFSNPSHIKMCLKSQILCWWLWLIVLMFSVLYGIFSFFISFCYLFTTEKNSRRQHMVFIYKQGSIPWASSSGLDKLWIKTKATNGMEEINWNLNIYKHLLNRKTEKDFNWTSQI